MHRCPGVTRITSGFRRTCGGWATTPITWTRTGCRVFPPALAIVRRTLRTGLPSLTTFVTGAACRHTVHGGAHPHNQALEAADRPSHVRPTLSTAHCPTHTDRRTLRLFYKFSPVGTSHAAAHYDPQDYEKYGLTDRQRAILAPPQAPTSEAAVRL